MSKFESLVGDPFFKIIENLDYIEINRLCSTTTQWSTFCNRKDRYNVWMYLLQRDYNVTNIKPEDAKLKYIELSTLVINAENVVYILNLLEKMYDIDYMTYKSTKLRNTNQLNISSELSKISNEMKSFNSITNCSLITNEFLEKIKIVVKMIPMEDPIGVGKNIEEFNRNRRDLIIPVDYEEIFIKLRNINSEIFFETPNHI